MLTGDLLRKMAKKITKKERKQERRNAYTQRLLKFGKTHFVGDTMYVGNPFQLVRHNYF